MDRKKDVAKLIEKDRVRKQLLEISKKLDDPTIFPKQGSYKCINCQNGTPFGFILRDMVYRLSQI